MKRELEWAGLNVQELEKEVTIRAELRYNMVGTLYPSILTAEIGELRVLIADRRGWGWRE